MRSLPARSPGERTPLVWPAGRDLRRIPVHNPTPVYPHSLLWRADNSHPALAALRTYLAAVRPNRTDEPTWVPPWARSGCSGATARHVQ
ncbi:hypothetical protein [Streptomyces broussonetiae]|uniref:hypothetical protein n=1 Tax=Streptomyces broussonetiae TaxID=2686304 RepID=UPI00389AED12